MDYYIIWILLAASLIFALSLIPYALGRFRWKRKQILQEPKINGVPVSKMTYKWDGRNDSKDKL